MLSRSAIKMMMEAGHIQIRPEPTHIGPNSIDLRLGDELKTYAYEGRVSVQRNQFTIVSAIDPHKPPALLDVPKLDDGRWLLVPGTFYLGCTLEETFCRGCVPHIAGRSTAGRLSLEVHRTAGVGDNGFRGRWTLEITVEVPLLVAPGDRLLQVYFEPCWSVSAVRGQLDMDDLELEDLYGEAAHYQDSTELRPPAPLD